MLKVLDNDYELIENYRDCFEIEDLNSRITEDFLDYDYIVGDYAYSKLRLKGFYEDNNKKAKSYNKISKKDDYIKNNCAYDCKYFVIKKI